MRHFCTYFDRNYLSRGLALYHSLCRHTTDFELHVLALDADTSLMLDRMNLPGIRVIRLPEIEESFSDLRAAKQTRSLIEYYFTCTPSLLAYILDTCPEVEQLTYLDADLYFFSDPEPLFREIGDRSIAIVGHRFPKHLLHHSKFGIYNVGWITFRRDPTGLSCLRRWQYKCIEWCYDSAEEGRFADQKYLDDWPDRYDGVVVLKHKGANVAPWNLFNYALTEREKRVWVDDEELLFYHFHGLEKVTEWLYDTHLNSFGMTASSVAQRCIYEPYIEELLALERSIVTFHGSRPESQTRIRGFRKGAKGTWLAKVCVGSLEAFLRRPRRRFVTCPIVRKNKP